MYEKPITHDYVCDVRCLRSHVTSLLKLLSNTVPYFTVCMCDIAAEQLARSEIEPWCHYCTELTRLSIDCPSIAAQGQENGKRCVKSSARLPCIHHSRRVMVTSSTRIARPRWQSQVTDSQSRKAGEEENTKGPCKEADVLQPPVRGHRPCIPARAE